MQDLKHALNLENDYNSYLSVFRVHEPQGKSFLHQVDIIGTIQKKNVIL